jgi:phage shock protein A
MEKRRHSDRVDGLKKELIECDSLVEQYQDDIRQLEDKLGTAREKQRILVQRHIHANGKKRAQQEIRRMESTEAIIKFEELENRIERMEAEADLVNFGRKPTLEGELDTLVLDDQIEKELENLKSSLTRKGKDTRAPKNSNH